MRAMLGLCVGQAARAVLTHFDETTHVVELGW
jgi:hypothetical protein